ncbi:hypothetical protein KUTeg_017001 [Tegillarca granosa]|uniref:Uncharacterized protein n=1 Tax=Tegillarca granosa TaxID=220873 RepID=A0ABQ9EMI6_TEGGR|nr:hypothetical protein KUTeg_017001 [Tegillarca granosa]
MAPRLGIVLVILALISYSDGVVPGNDVKCSIPDFYHGNWYSQEAGVDIDTLVNGDFWEIQTLPRLKLECIQSYTHIIKGVEQDGQNRTMLMKEITNDPNPCYFCVDVLWRTKAILQYRKDDCVKPNSGVNIDINVTCKAMDSFFGLPGTDETFTMFKKDPPNINCITTFEGVYQFSYEVDVGGGGICNNPKSQIKACQDPGSPYVDNQVFRMTYAKCADVSTSRDDQIRYQCLGSWFAVKSGVGYTYAAIMDTVEGDPREVYKCLMTLRNQKDANNQIRWVMSRFAECGSLNSIYRGPLKLVLTRIPPPTPYMSPKCNLPRNITGSWLTQGIQYRSDVVVNDTHLIMSTKINQFEFQETHFSCQQTLGTRYLMTKVVVGKCEVDFVCFDIMPRHHSIVRYRVVNPPSAVPCPIAGRYYFTQEAINEDEKYATRIRGVTLRPRIQVDCRDVQAEFKSCSMNMDKIEVDAEYCETVDYRGRPIGEYGKFIAVF